MHVPGQVTQTGIVPIYEVNFGHRNGGLTPQIDPNGLGSMVFGVSKYPDGKKSSVERPAPKFTPASQSSDPGGLTIAVEHTNTSTASRTLYLKLPVQIGEAGTLIAEVVARCIHPERSNRARSCF